MLHDWSTDNPNARSVQRKDSRERQDVEYIDKSVRAERVWATWKWQPWWAVNVQLNNTFIFLYGPSCVRFIFRWLSCIQVLAFIHYHNWGWKKLGTLHICSFPIHSYLVLDRVRFDVPWTILKADCRRMDMLCLDCIVAPVLILPWRFAVIIKGISVLQLLRISQSIKQMCHDKCSWNLNLSVDGNSINLITNQMISKFLLVNHYVIRKYHYQALCKLVALKFHFSSVMVASNWICDQRKQNCFSQKNRNKTYVIRCKLFYSFRSRT